MSSESPPSATSLPLGSLYRRLTEPTRDRDTPFLVDGRGRTVRHATFHTWCDRIADVLRAHGVEPSDRVVVQVPKSVEALALYLAVLRIGAIYVPLNPAYTRAEVDVIVTDADPALVVTELGAAGPPAGRTAHPGEIIAAADRAKGSDPDTSAVDGQPVTMLYTSGTTGRPKGAPSSASGLIANAADLSALWGISGDDTLLHVLPLFHVHGLFVAMHPILMAGARVTLQPRFDVGATLDGLVDATIMMAVPTMYRRLLADGRIDRRRTSSIRLFTSGSAPLPAADHDAFAQRTGHAIVERYGLTETGILTSNRIGEETPGSVGTPLPSVDLRIAAPAGDIGEIQVTGPSVTPGYWRVPDATAAAFTSDGWFRTGDLGHLDGSGRLTLVGRSKDVIISGGLNLYPAEIESAVLASGTVSEVAVVGVPHPDLGEAAVAVVVGSVPGSGDLADLAVFKQPRRWFVVDELPRNAMGKVRREVLRDRYRDAF